VFYEVLRVSEQVSVNPVALPPTPLRNFLWLLLSFNVCYSLSINLSIWVVQIVHACALLTSCLVQRLK